MEKVLQKKQVFFKKIDFIFWWKNGYYLLDLDFLRISLGNKLELPLLVGKRPFRSGLTWAFSLMGQPVFRLQDGATTVMVKTRIINENKRKKDFLDIPDDFEQN